LSALKALVNWSVAADLPGITCPVLVLTADADYTPLAVKQAYTAQLPDAQLVVIADARHFMTIERPDAVNQALIAFLDAHAPVMK
jgi:pimeloyl-ACP methyl ester carboxylesterase